MPYRYGIKNQFRPTSLAPNAYGWTSSPQYNRADVPTGLMDRPTNISAEQFLQQFAYEWFDSSNVSTGAASQNAAASARGSFSNPPFVSGAAGRLHPALQSGSGSPARILRGFIRRAQHEAGDNLSRARLYFMYNPEIISRDYVSYLEQGALDPFNTVYQSGNLVAPPSILDFSFELFFDRQEEATQVNHPGVFVDYQFFDLVVRNVVPSDPNQASNTLPDNGLMMVNPRDITVVFSPQMTIQGRPLNARVTFERFTHRMTPTRMRIALTMRAVYMGPLKEITEYRAESFPAEASIPFGESETWTSTITIGEINQIEQGGPVDSDTEDDYYEQLDISNEGNGAVRAKALNWAKGIVVPGETRYVDGNSGSARWNLPASADCSGLVTASYTAIGAMQEVFGTTQHIGTETMLGNWQGNGYKNVKRFSYEDITTGRKLTYGDLLIRPGHVMFFDSYSSDGKFNIFAAQSASSNPQVGPHNGQNLSTTAYIGISPRPVGANGNANAANSATSLNTTRATP